MEQAKFRYSFLGEKKIDKQTSWYFKLFKQF